jgi:hypothetical protein
VARQAGHSPEECLRTYAHTFEEFDPADRQPAEVVIAASRKAHTDPDDRDQHGARFVSTRNDQLVCLALFEPVQRLRQSSRRGPGREDFVESHTQHPGLDRYQRLLAAQVAQNGAQL